MIAMRALSIFIIVCLLLLAIGVILLFYPDLHFYIHARRIRRVEQRKQDRQKFPIFSQSLVNASKLMIKMGKRIEYPILESDNFLRRCIYFYAKSNRASVFTFMGAECGWLLYALTEYLDDVHYVRSVFNDKILPIPIKQVEQSQCGMVALYLYKKTNEDVYKKYADSVYGYLLSQDTDYGIVFRAGDKGNRILVDTLGMAIPFLTEYGKMFGLEEAVELAERSLEQYVEYGVDDKTGIPAFAFRIPSPHIKLGCPNWGRGVAWFILGLMYVDVSHLSANTQNKIIKFERSIIELWNKNKSFRHFLCEGGRDLSAELPILYYLVSKNQICLSENDLMEYSTMSHQGLMYHSSSSNVGIVRYGTCAGPNVLSQAYMLRLITLYKGRSRNQNYLQS